MPKTYFVVRSTIADPALRKKFDHWYGTDHMPWALKEFKCEKAWRLWSEVDPSIHEARYQFADLETCNAAVNSEGMKALKADFDRVFPTVTRTRDVLVMADEQAVS